MYLSHFSLKEEPFGVSPDCRFFYQSEQHKESVASLYYAIRQRRGFGLLIDGALALQGRRITGSSSGS